MLWHYACYVYHQSKAWIDVNPNDTVSVPCSIQGYIKWGFNCGITVDHEMGL